MRKWIHHIAVCMAYFLVFTNLLISCAPGFLVRHELRLIIFTLICILTAMLTKIPRKPNYCQQCGWIQ